MDEVLPDDGDASMARRAPFLVLAHHRSGSNFLHDLLQAHPGVECINEPFSMHALHFRQRDLERWTADDYDSRILHPSLREDAVLVAWLTQFRGYLLRSSERRVLGFKETVLFGKLAWLDRFVPGLKIIFLQRDGRAIVSSVLRSGLLDFWQYEERVSAAFGRMHPTYRRLRGADRRLRDVELAAMSVVCRYELAKRELSGFPHLVVAIEAICDQPERELVRLCHFLDLVPIDSQREFLHDRRTSERGGDFSSYRFADDVRQGWRRSLTREDLEVIEEVFEQSRLPLTEDDHVGP